MSYVKQHVCAEPLAVAPTLANLGFDRASYDITRRKLHLFVVVFHKALAFVIEQISALAARSFGNERAAAFDTGRMKLHHLRIAKSKTRAQCRRDTVAGSDIRHRGAVVKHPRISARSDYQGFAKHGIKIAGLDISKHDALAFAVRRADLKQLMID